MQHFIEQKGKDAQLVIAVECGKCYQVTRVSPRTLEIKTCHHCGIPYSNAELLVEQMSLWTHLSGTTFTSSAEEVAQLKRVIEMAVTALQQSGSPSNASALHILQEHGAVNGQAVI